MSSSGTGWSPLLGRIFGHAARDGVALEETGAEAAGLGYRALLARAEAIAGAIAERGGADAGAGEPIAFLAPPGALYVEALLGIMAAGAMAVPLSPLHTAPELAWILENAAPRLLLATPALRGQAAAAVAAVRDAGPDGATSGGPRRDRAPEIVDLAALAVKARPGATPEPAGVPGDPAGGAAAPALMLYTSGTTGRPKGVVLSHGAVAATLAALESAWRWRPGDRLLHVLPLHHTHGLIVALLGALWAGATTRFAPFEAEATWERLGEATLFMAVPTMYAKMMEAFGRAPAERRTRWADHARRLRLATSGSAALPAPLLRALREATGQTVLERYGMTEIGMALSNAYDGPRLPGSVGAPLPGVEVDIVGDDGRELPDGEPGELRVRTPQLFSRYHRDDAATAASFDPAGRFRTGDTGVRDRSGAIRLLGRTSVDVLKSGGYKISALEIEAALRDHPAIDDIAVIGAPDPSATWGDIVTACVVPRAGATLTLAELKDFARDRLAVYKIPRALRLLPALPRNAMGKVQKKRLLAEEKEEAGP